MMYDDTDTQAIYPVTITEFLSRTVEIAADSEEEALDIARQRYRDGQIILIGDDFVDTDFDIR